MPNDLRARRTEREADCDLLLSSSTTGQQQAREIGAHNQKHESNGPEHHCIERLLDAGELGAERRRVRSPFLLRFRIRLLETLGDSYHFAVGIRERDAGTKTRDNTEVALISRAAGRVRNERHPEVGEFRELEPRRHDADHGVRDAVDSNCLSDDAAIGAIASREESVAQQHDRRGPDTVVVGREAAAKRWMDAKKVECLS